MRKQGDEWYNFAEDELPNPKEFQERQMKSAMKAMAMFVQQQMQQSKLTGVPLDISVQAVAQAVTKQQMLDNNPMLGQELQKHQKQQKQLAAQ